MQNLKFIFPLMGVVLLGAWLFKTTTSFEGGASSIQSLSDIQNKYQYLAILGFACFWIIPTINWFKSGSKFNTSEVISTIKEYMNPTHGRKVPIWAHVVRITGLAAFIYFMAGAVQTLNDEIVFNWNYFLPAAFSAALFFLLPFVFQRKTQ